MADLAALLIAFFATRLSKGYGVEEKTGAREGRFRLRLADDCTE